MKSGVYYIKSTLDGRQYVGSSKNLLSRMEGHAKALLRGTHENQLLQNYVRKYGFGVLEFGSLEWCSVERMLEREQHYIDTLNPYFNICRVAGNCLGVKHSSETRAKLSAIHKGRKVSEETKRKISLAQIGRKNPLTAERNRKRKGLPGRPQTEETKRKIGAANAGRKRPDLTALNSSRTRSAFVGGP